MSDEERIDLDGGAAGAVDPVEVEAIFREKMKALQGACLKDEGSSEDAAKAAFIRMAMDFGGVQQLGAVMDAFNKKEDASMFSFQMERKKEVTRYSRCYDLCEVFLLKNGGHWENNASRDYAKGRVFRSTIEPVLKSINAFMLESNMNWKHDGRHWRIIRVITPKGTSYNESFFMDVSLKEFIIG